MKKKMILIRLAGAAMDGKRLIPEDDYGKDIFVDYHVNGKLHRCTFGYGRSGIYFLTAILPYAEKEPKNGKK